MKEGLLVYLLIGVILGLAIEVAWPYFADEEDGEIGMAHRMCIVFLWPIILLVAIINAVNNNDDEGPREGWGY